GGAAPEHEILEYRSWRCGVLMSFSITQPKAYEIGEGKRATIAPAALAFGQRVLLVTGRNSSRAGFLLSDLHNAGAFCESFPCDGEPTLALIEKGRALARELKIDVVVGFGGGSAIDSGKAIAAMASNPG